jgi:hypothetical protein
LAPSIIYYQSAWNSNIAAYDSVIGISLDTYLGADHKITKQLTPEMFPNYKKENMDSKYIVADAMKGWVAWKARTYYEQKDLLSELVFYGKLMYIAEALAPDQPDSLMMSWSASQIDWALKNEWNTWKVLANEPNPLKSTNGLPTAHSQVQRAFHKIRRHNWAYGLVGILCDNTWKKIQQ